MDWPRKPREQPWKSYDARSTVVKVWSPRSAGGERPGERPRSASLRSASLGRTPPALRAGLRKKVYARDLWIGTLPPWITWDGIISLQV